MGLIVKVLLAVAGFAAVFLVCVVCFVYTIGQMFEDDEGDVD